MKSNVVVVGSCHQCFFLLGNKLPAPGETVFGHTFFQESAGKGSNQAVVCAKLGGAVSLVERLGADHFGKVALNNYKELGIDTANVILDETTHTGIASIVIDKDGHNLIMVVPGANSRLSVQDIDNAAEYFTNAFIAGFVLEVSVETVERAVKLARSNGAETFLDPAPVVPFDDRLYESLTYIKPNEHEASLLTGIKVVDAGTAVKAGRWFVSKGVANAIITLGESGSVLVNGDGDKHFPSPKVVAVDSTAAGDTFAGAFLSARAAGKTVDESVVFANCAAALSVTKPGAMASIPSLEEVERVSRQLGKAPAKP